LNPDHIESRAFAREREACQSNRRRAGCLVAERAGKLD